MCAARVAINAALPIPRADLAALERMPEDPHADRCYALPGGVFGGSEPWSPRSTRRSSADALRATGQARAMSSPWRSRGPRPGCPRRRCAKVRRCLLLPLRCRDAWTDCRRGLHQRGPAVLESLRPLELWVRIRPRASESRADGLDGKRPGSGACRRRLSFVHGPFAGRGRRGNCGDSDCRTGEHRTGSRGTDRP